MLCVPACSPALRYVAVSRRCPEAKLPRVLVQHVGCPGHPQTPTSKDARLQEVNLGCASLEGRACLSLQQNLAHPDGHTAVQTFVRLESRKCEAEWQDLAHGKCHLGAGPRPSRF